MNIITTNYCAFCNSKYNLTKHHLIPQSIQNRKKIKNTKADMIGEIITLCSTCHSALHSKFTEKQLAESLYTLDLLKNNKEINQFIKWKIKHPNINFTSSKKSKFKI